MVVERDGGDGRGERGKVMWREGDGGEGQEGEAKERAREGEKGGGMYSGGDAKIRMAKTGSKNNRQRECACPSFAYVYMMQGGAASGK